MSKFIDTKINFHEMKKNVLFSRKMKRVALLLLMVSIKWMDKFEEMLLFVDFFKG